MAVGVVVEQAPVEPDDLARAESFAQRIFRLRFRPAVLTSRAPCPNLVADEWEIFHCKLASARDGYLLMPLPPVPPSPRAHTRRDPH